MIISNYWRTYGSSVLLSLSSIWQSLKKNLDQYFEVQGIDLCKKYYISFFIFLKNWMLHFIIYLFTFGEPQIKFCLPRGSSDNSFKFSKSSKWSKVVSPPLTFFSQFLPQNPISNLINISSICMKIHICICFS